MMAMLNFCWHHHLFSSSTPSNQALGQRGRFVAANIHGSQMCWQVRRRPKKVSPWTGLRRPGRSRWWRRSRLPTASPILYTGGQRHGPVSSMETGRCEKNGTWPPLRKMAGWINMFPEQSEINGQPPPTCTYPVIHAHLHHAPNKHGNSTSHKQNCMRHPSFFFLFFYKVPVK